MTTVFKFFGKLPLSFLRSLGFFFSWVYWFSSKKYRLRFKKNWEIANKYSGSAMDKANLNVAIGRAGTFVFELPKIWCGENLNNKVEVDGYDMIENLLTQGRGLICLSPHLGSFELVPKIFSRKIPIHILYKPSNNIHLDQILKELRPSKNINMVEPNFSGVRKLFIALKKGEIVGLLPDQVPPFEYGTFEPFFGQLAYTMTLASKLILMTGTPVVWINVRYKKNGWRVIINPWDSKVISKINISEMTRAMNEKIEELVLEEPESYMWGYDRYKTPKKIFSENNK